MEKGRARAWVIFVVVAMVVHGVGETFDIQPLTFLLIMPALAVFSLRAFDKK